MKKFLPRRLYPSPHNFLSPFYTQHQRQLSRFAKMPFSYCDDRCLFHIWQAAAPSPSSTPASPLACGGSPARHEGKEQAAWDLVYLITMTNKEKLRKKGAGKNQKSEESNKPGKIYVEMEKIRVKPPPSRATGVVLQTRCDPHAVLCCKKSIQTLHFRKLGLVNLCLHINQLSPL